jgi:hypothetical protein
MYKNIWRRPQAYFAVALVIGVGGLGFASASHLRYSAAGLDLKLAGSSLYLANYKTAA